MNTTRIALVAAFALLATGQVMAQSSNSSGKKGGSGGGTDTEVIDLSSSITVPPLRSWMSPEIGNAWRQGYQGQRTTITVIDDFASGRLLKGNLQGTTQSLHHGEWTRMQSSLVAPLATMAAQDFSATRSVTLGTGFNVLNLSYGMMATAGLSTINWSSREQSIIAYAREGRAVISKSAGNDGNTVAVGQTNSSGRVDYLGRDLIGAQSAIFVGALSTNGTTRSPASIASYSNVAGTNAAVQKQFLVVGVEGSKTGLYGTSFAAPIVSGYAAIVSSKFTTATPTAVANQLLNTARQDTIRRYNPAIHGRGEASIARALAPTGIQ